MNRISLSLFALFLSATFAGAVESTSVAQEVRVYDYPATTVKAHGVKINYPTGRWSIQRRELDDKKTLIQLKAKSASLVALQIIVSSYDSDIRDAHYNNHPNAANTAVLLSMTESFPIKEGSKFIYSIGTVIMPSGHWDTTTRAHAELKNNKVACIESCHEYHADTNTMLNCVVMTEGLAVGGLLEDGSYANLVAEAYAIIHQISFGQ